MAKISFFDEKHEFSCEDPCCSKMTPFLNHETAWVCKSCGVVISPHYINVERRAYNFEEINSRRRTESIKRQFGARTVIGQNFLDAHGKHLIPQKRALFSRLSKIQGSLINSLERNYWEARPKMGSICTRLNLPDYIQETAWSIYKISAKKKLTMGRSIEGFVAASVYAAIRVHEYPRLLEEVVESSLLQIRIIHKSLGLIVRYILPKLGLKYHPILSERLIHRFGNELDLSMEIQQNARRMLFQSRRNGLPRTGKDPKGIAAAVLYLAARNTTEKRTQSQISVIARITEVTLRTRAKQISKYTHTQPHVY
jgi:transcription initiation factor TFIIB